MANKRENFEIGDLTMQCQNKKPLIIKYCLKVKNSDCLVRNYVLSARSIVSVKPQTSSLWHEAVRRFFYKGMRLHTVPSKAAGVRPVPRNFTLLRQNTVAEISCGKTELTWLVRYKFSWWSKVWWTPSKEGVSGWSRTSSSSMLPKICGISLAMEYENGNSSARRVDSALEAWNASIGWHVVWEGSESLEWNGGR